MVRDAREVVLDDFAFGRGQVIDELGERGSDHAVGEHRFQFRHPAVDVEKAAEDGPLLGIVESRHEQTGSVYDTVNLGNARLEHQHVPAILQPDL